ncbi:Synaptotagmin-2 [Ananas comosus]|uniref:Synaptotagmin-2 n=1 Tax=Ananas comosus TaxID=4615 RepID=A0A199W495_ANACO|nr:Synaptotagmin-2 [Ananas comosus]
MKNLLKEYLKYPNPKSTLSPCWFNLVLMQFFFPLLKALPSIGIPKSHSMQVISQLPTISIPSTAGYTSSLLGYSIFPQLQGILQANMLQRVLGFVSTALGFTKFGAGLTAGVVIGYYLFIYFQLTDVKMR